MRFLKPVKRLLILGLSPAVPSLPRGPFAMGWLQYQLREADAAIVSSVSSSPTVIFFFPDFLTLPFVFILRVFSFQPLMTLWTLISFDSSIQI